ALVLLVVPLLLGCVLVGCPLLVGVCPCWMSPCCWGVCCWLCVWPCVPVRRWALCSAQSTSFARAKKMLVCRVAPLVERCDTCLWLLPALCWLVANFGELLPEFFSVGSGGELFVVVLVRVPLPLELLLCSLKSATVLPPWFEVSVVWLVAIALPSRLRCITWLPCVLVRFSRIIGCCPGEVPLRTVLACFC
ncbi:hypothetical protein Taro_048582, partial [Colocasia esculenta]|nr:hypothetical protein [Colocasia esculenta]